MLGRPPVEGDDVRLGAVDGRDAAAEVYDVRRRRGRIELEGLRSAWKDGRP